MPHFTRYAAALALSASLGTGSCTPAEVLPEGEATLDSSAPENADAACAPQASSTLAHVSIAVDASTCTFTLAQAMAGVSIPYDVVVNQDVPDFTPASPYIYGADVANLALNEVLSGGTQRYCDCDKGLPFPRCPVGDAGTVGPFTDDAGKEHNEVCGPITIPAGVYHRTFTWDGRNWGGPSDTGNPMGAPFPPGDYQFAVTTSAGLVGDSGLGSAGATLTIRLVP